MLRCAQTIRPLVQVLQPGKQCTNKDFSAETIENLSLAI